MIFKFFCQKRIIGCSHENPKSVDYTQSIFCFNRISSKILDFSQKLKQRTDKLRNAVWREQVELLSLYYLLVSFLLRNPDPKHFAFENTRHYVGIHIFCQGAQLAIPEAGHSAKAIAEFQEYKNVYRMCVYVTSLLT